jgi:O-antigen ligase
MYFLNYIYFFIITGIGIKFLFQKRGIVTDPLNKSQVLAFDGPELFWVLTFSTGLLAFSAPAVLDLMAIRLAVLEVLCLIGIFIVKRKPAWSASMALYLFYLIWLIIGLCYSPSLNYGFRVILKYLYPFLIMLFASAVVRDKEVFLKAGLGARMAAVISIVTAFIPYVEKTLLPGVIWYGTARTINYISICVFSLALFYHTNEKIKNLWLAVLFMAPCIFWVFRTSIMGTALALMTFFFFRYKLKSLPVIFGVLFLFIVAIFYIPGIKEKMFTDARKKDVSQLREREISMNDINSNGRFIMWKSLMNKFYSNKEFTGYGTGNMQNYMYSHRVFGGIKVPHNDYVQILCDNGLIGLVLYLLSALLAVIHCFIIYNKKQVSIPAKICAIAAGASMAGILLTMYTDNVVNYSMATLSYPFGFYGMMLGLNKK